MIKLSARQHHKSACQFRQLSTGNDQANPRAALDSCRVRFSLRDAGSAYRERPIGFVTPLIVSQTAVQWRVGNPPPAPKSP